MTTYKKRDEGLLWHSSKQDKKEPGMETNKDTRIYLLSRCVELKYAERLLYQGSLFFSYPIKWIKEGQKGNDGQGDALEGVYSNEINFRNVFLRKRARLVRGKKGWYLRSRNIENNWLCVCFFSASDMTKKRQDGDTLVFDMSEAYAKAFSGEETWENRFKKPLLERKAMVVMHRPDVFLDRVKCFFAGNGLEEGRDFCMGLVHYRKDWEKFTYKDVPWELFHKEGRFKAQQEFRIALNPESQKMREMLKGGQEICIGSIEDCAMLKSHFYKGAEIRVKGDDVRLEVRDLSN